MNEITLALVKPHLANNRKILNLIINTIEKDFLVLKYDKIFLTEKLAAKFYEEHHGKFYYNRLVTYMSSGPSYGFILSSPDCVVKWRNLIGPTKVFQSVYSHPKSLRSLYGLTDTRNGFHGSDSKESAKKEISLLFPDFNIDEVENTKNLN